MSVMLYPCIFCVALLMNLFVLCVACLIVFVVNCLIKQFAIFWVYLLLNVMEVLSVGGGALLDALCMAFQRMRSQCVSRCSFHRLGLCMSEVIII